MTYYQHRISHKWDVSKQLFDQGYITIGWSGLIDTDILQETKEHGENGFIKSAERNNLTDRLRWCLYRFLSFEPGDIVLIPLYEQDFAIVEISGDPQPISELPIKSFQSVAGRLVELNSKLKYTDNNEEIDLGYFVPINKESVKFVRRAYASAKLQARMKHQFVNIEINDLEQDVKDALSATGPIDLRDIILEAAAPKIQEAMSKLTPDGLEHLVKWYMQQSGASRVVIPAKNEAGKENGADADVIAEFDSLGLVFFIQVKKHEGYTDDWAIEQIRLYKEQKENLTDNFTYIPWVITTASFQDSVKEKAHDVGVRLIDGVTFAKMIADTGVKSINEVIEYIK